MSHYEMTVLTREPLERHGFPRIGEGDPIRQEGQPEIVAITFKDNDDTAWIMPWKDVYKTGNELTFLRFSRRCELVQYSHAWMEFPFPLDLLYFVGAALGLVNREKVFRKAILRAVASVREKMRDTTDVGDILKREYSSQNAR